MAKLIYKSLVTKKINRRTSIKRKNKKLENLCQKANMRQQPVPGELTEKALIKRIAQTSVRTRGGGVQSAPKMRLEEK